MYSGRTTGRELLKFKEVKTHILDRMSVFFSDDKILFLPKDERRIERDIQQLDGTRDRYHTQEVGIFYKIIEQLKLQSPDEEQRYLSVHQFIMQNSKEISNQSGDAKAGLLTTVEALENKN